MFSGQVFVEGASDSQSPALEHVSIDHGRADILVAQQFLNGVDIIVEYQFFAIRWTRLWQPVDISYFVEGVHLIHSIYKEKRGRMNWLKKLFGGQQSLSESQRPPQTSGLPNSWANRTPRYTFNETQKEIISYLQHCHGSELVDILEQVLPTRLEAESYVDAHEAVDERMFLGMALRRNLSDDLDQIEWGLWELAGIGYADPTVYQTVFKGEPFWQEGECDACRIPVCSNVKNAICPICGRKVYLT